MKAFQICYEGELTLEMASAIRRLRGTPNFDSSWIVGSGEHRRADVLLRYLRPCAPEGTLIVGRTDYSRSRPFLLIRHSVTPGFDYAPFHEALAAVGSPLDLPMSSTYLVPCDEGTDSRALGARLEGLIPYDSIMVVGIGHDVAVTTSSGLYEAPEDWMVRTAERPIFRGGEM